MVVYNLSFNYAALGIYFVLLISYICRKKVRILEARIFLALLIVSMCSTIADIMSTTAHMHPTDYSKLYLYVSSVAYLLFHNMSAFLFAMYIISMSGDTYESFPFYLKTVLFVPFVLIMLLILLSGFTGMFFYFDEAGIYHRGPYQFLLYIVTAFYLFIGIGYTIKKQVLSVSDTAQIVTMVIACGFGGPAYQLFHPYQMVENFCVALCILIILVLIHKPEDYIDPVLSIYNIKTFTKQFKATVSKRRPSAVVIIYIEDLNLMTSILGLDSITVILNYIARYFDIVSERQVFYLESHTFAVMLPSVAPGVVGNFITRVEERFLEEWNSGKNTVLLTNRFMTVRIPEDTTDINTIFAYVDYLRSLDNSKHWVLFAKDVALRDSRRYFEIESRIKNAVAGSNFEVYYQPIVDAKTGKVVSAEALIRLADHCAEYLSPAVFIPMAEQNGSILQIGELLFEDVCRFIRRNDLERLGMSYIEINLSVVQCIQDHMAEYFLQILNNYHVEPHFINLEITETAAVDSPKSLIRNIQRLHSRGISFSLDDFGTGYTTINSLLELPVSIVKFDKTMTDSATETEKGRMVLGSSITMIKRMGMNIVSEGIETEEQVKLFKSMGVDYFQGYYFSKPLPAADFIAFVERFNHIENNLELLETV